ncbi:hypothetical protein B0T21DRAFT_61424 [Apiosordaria backusii]|uniref:Zn(2)-C6 fungal-type domain-containing protein n=1 Tax=Apiosordaria backusii TaxID=314023 RepID=A0AA40DWQ4_9PEZI|nr:hypothetical protein B0T21DRAFT_61424 [Apiosordaria backusii]
MSSPSTSTSASGSGSSPGALPGLAKFGCINCREQHLKCDRVTPTCGRCQTAGRTCRPTGLKIRVNTENGKFKFARKQKWVKAPKQFIWIDETASTSGHDQSSPESGAEDFDVDVSNYAASPELASPGTATAPQSATLSQVSSIPAESTHSPSGLVALNRCTVDGLQFAAEKQPFAVNAPLGLEEPSKWPLPQGTEGALIRNFVENLALWLDLCDPNQSFQIEVPRRAAKSAILRDAMLALSARHLANTCRSSYYEAQAQFYNSRCIENLIKAGKASTDWLIDHEPRLAENCFGAAIILRVMEEMQESRTPSVSNERHYPHIHLLGIREYTHSYVSGHKGLTPGTLAAASFWVGLRQDIYFAVMKKSTVKLSLVSALPSKDPYEDLEDDYYWANRAVVHCANVLNFCHGEEANRTLERWVLLIRENENWAGRMGRGENNKLASRREESDFWVPYVKEIDVDGSKPFPEIWYLRSCQVIGMQHFLLASAFLFSNQPRIEMASREAADALAQRVQALVREICGIGLGNKSIAPSMFTACMAIAAFGHLFSMPKDQQAMLRILEQTEKDHARPTLEVQQRMKKVWGWR